VGRLRRVAWAGCLLASGALADETLPDAEMLLFLAEFADDSGEVVDPDALIEVMTPVANEASEANQAGAARPTPPEEEESDDVEL